MKKIRKIKRAIRYEIEVLTENALSINDGRLTDSDKAYICGLEDAIELIERFCDNEAPDKRLKGIKSGIFDGFIFSKTKASTRKLKTKNIECSKCNRSLDYSIAQMKGFTVHNWAKNHGCVEWLELQKKQSK